MGGGELLKQNNHGLIIQPVPRKRLAGAFSLLGLCGACGSLQRRHIQWNGENFRLVAFAASGSHHWCDCIQAGSFPAIASNELSDDLAPISRHQTHSADYDAQFAWLFADLLLFSGQRPATGQSLFLGHNYGTTQMMVNCQLYGRFNGDCRWKFMIYSSPALQPIAIEKGLVPVSPIPPFSSRLQRTRRNQKDSQHPCMMYPKSMDPPALTADCPRKAAKRQS